MNNNTFKFIIKPSKKFYEGYCFDGGGCIGNCDSNCCSNCSGNCENYGDNDN